MRCAGIRRRSPAAIVLLLMVLVAIFAPWLGTIDPQALSPIRRLKPIGGEFWFGTDMLGRDVYSRVIYGSARVADRRLVRGAASRPRSGWRSAW